MTRDIFSLKFLRFAVLAAVFSIPVGTKKFLFTFWGSPSEISSAFLYGTDILVVLAIFCFFFKVRQERTNRTFRTSRTLQTFFGIFLGFTLVSLFFAGDAFLGGYFLFKLVLAVLFALVLTGTLRKGVVSPREVFLAFFASAAVQSLIGILQFALGQSVGLRLLGESVIGKGMEGVGRVVIQGTEFLRAYGTMPHSNILAAFLGLGSLALFALWLNSYSRAGNTAKFFFGAGFYMIFFGVVITFSRSGWIALAAAFAFTFAALFMTRPACVGRRKEFFEIITPVVIAAALVFVSMQWAIAPRAHLSASEPSVGLRVLYNNIGVAMLAERPFGVGIGNQLPQAIRENIFREFGIMREGDFQPIHNLYLLIAVELGIQGLLVFLVLFGNVFIGTLRQIKHRNEIIIPAAMMVFVAVFGLFDHFFWTLEAGRLMFWGVLGIVMGISRPRGITDRTPPSEGGDRGSIPLGGT